MVFGLLEVSQVGGLKQVRMFREELEEAKVHPVFLILQIILMLDNIHIFMLIRKIVVEIMKLM